MLNSMKACIISLAAFLFLGCGILPAQTNTPAAASSDDKNKKVYALEKLVLEPQELGLEAQRTIDGMVINTKSPVKVVANDAEQSSMVMSSEFRDKNLRYAARGMHSWMTVTYKLTDEDNKLVTVYVMEFESNKHARLSGLGIVSNTKDGEPDQKDEEFKGSLFYSYLRGPILLKVTWSDTKSPGVERIIDAYKTRLLTM
jgi:hypothetical protein